MILRGTKMNEETPKRIKIIRAFRLAPELDDAVKAIGVKTERNATAVVIDALEQYVERFPA